MLELIVLCFLSYLLGSIPTSVWVGKWFYGIDIREHGSGNAGATNTLRVLGAKAAIPVFVFDVFKGFVIPFLSGYIIEAFPGDAYLYKIVIGFCAVIGHIYPIFAGFRGGKGVATLLGMTLGISPIPSLIALSVFVVVFAAFRYVSLGSLSAATVYPFAVYFFTDPSTSLYVFSIFALVLLFYTHRKNIVRLWKGEEHKFARDRK